MVKTDEVLRTLLEMGFGCVRLNEAMFRGSNCKSPKIPKSYFATDRLGKHSDAPVNRMCAERVLRLFEIGFSGQSRHDACSVLRMLRAEMLELFRVETLDFVYDGSADPICAGKMEAQIAFLRIAMTECMGGERVERAAVVGLVEAEADRRRAKMAFGMSAGCNDDDVCGFACGGCLHRPEVVSSVTGRMEVVRRGNSLVMVF